MKDKNGQKVKFLSVVSEVNNIVKSSAPWTTTDWIDILEYICFQFEIFFYWITYPARFLIKMIWFYKEIKKGNIWR